MRKIIPLLVIVCLLAAPPAAAQAVETWYFAHDLEQGQLLAYTAAGETRTLIASGLDRLPLVMGWRTGPAAALLRVPIAGQMTFYRATPEAAEPLVVEGLDAAAIDEAAWNILARRDSLLALADSVQINREAPGLLVDLRAGTAAALTGEVLVTSAHPLAFTPEGRLRYVSRSADEEVWRLRERDPQTGEESLIYEFPSAFEVGDPPRVTADSTGQRWLFGLPSDQRLLQPDGGVLSLAALGRGVEAQIAFDHLLTYAPNCRENCSFSWEPLAGGGGQRYLWPWQGLENYTWLFVLDRLSETELLIAVSDARGWGLFRTTAGGEASPLGRWQGRDEPRVLNGLSRGGVLSPDGRWLLAVTETGYAVWDLPANREAPLGPALADGQPVGALWGDDGFVLTIAGAAETAILYRATDEQALTLPGERIYTEVLPDGSVLFARGFAGSAGIARYDTASGAETPLLAGALPINLFGLPS